MVEHFNVKLECGACPTRIWQYNGIKLKKTDEYHEAHVRLSDLSNMTVGVCSEHQEITDTELPIISEKMHKGWVEEVALGIGNKEWVNDIGSWLTVVGVGG